MQIYNLSHIDDTEEHRKIMIVTFGRNIKNLRIKKRLTQESLSALAEINEKYLGEIERGEKCPTAVVVYKISKALGVSVCEILSTDDCRCIDENLLKVKLINSDFGLANKDKIELLYQIQENTLILIKKIPDNSIGCDFFTGDIFYKK